MGRIVVVGWSIALGLASACGAPCTDDGLHARQNGAACLAAGTTGAATTTGADTTTTTTTTTLSSTGAPDSESSGATTTAVIDTGGSSGTTEASTGTTTTGATTAEASSTGPGTTCANGMQDPGETGPDCGGVCVVEDPERTCEMGVGCVEDGDCTSLHCHDKVGVCTEALCDNGVYDPGTDYHVDCGLDCPGCGLGLPCNDEGNGCSVGECVSGLCALKPSCHNDLLDADETDLDCGGACGPSCKHQMQCDGGGDCIAGSCVDGVCDDPGCYDDMQDGDDTDADCGGSCAPCTTGKSCIADSDCAFFGCFANACAG